MLRRIAPALVLFFVTPLIAEYLLGSVSLAQLAAWPVLSLLYGGGVLLIREIARRSGRGWRGILLLGLAYALVEEGFATQSLFNPHFLGLRLLDYGYLPTMGIGASWTVYVLSLHVIWSVAVPIALIEGMYPARADTPWLGRAGLIVSAALFLLGVAAVARFMAGSQHFLATPRQFAAAGLAVLGVLGLAWRLPRDAGSAAPSAAVPPRPRLLAGILFAAGSAFELLVRFGPAIAPWPVLVPAVLLLEGGAVVLIARWCASGAWTLEHRGAAAAGGLGVYAWWGFLVAPDRIGGPAFYAHLALALVAVAWAVRLCRPRAGAVAGISPAVG